MAIPLRSGPRRLVARAGVVIQTPAALNPVKKRAKRAIKLFGDQLSRSKPTTTPASPYLAVLIRPSFPTVKATSKEPTR